jgi:hypothetical protein
MGSLSQEEVLPAESRKRTTRKTLLAKRLVKRTSTEAPKPLPARGKEPEQDTYLCKGAELVVKPEDKVPMLGRCVKCKVMQANSEADHLCYGCHKAAEGFELGTDKYVKIKKGKK